jgi:hypothetical protein
MDTFLKRQFVAVITFVVLVQLVGLAAPEPLRGNQREMRAAFNHLERLTGLRFKKEVGFETQTRDEFQAFLREEMEKTFPGDQLRRIGRVYSLLGLVPLDYRLENRLPDLYRDQVGAYYDPATESIYQVTGGLDRASRYFLYLHEGMHALQDQYHDLGRLQQRYAREGTLDEQMAFSFVIEGHANLVAMAAQMRAGGLDKNFFDSARFGMFFRMFSQLTELSPEQFDAITRLFSQGSSPSARSLSKLRGVPLVLVQQMTDPYLLGQYLLFERAKREGFERVREWVGSPPTSTKELFFEESSSEYGRYEFRGRGDFETTMGSYLMMRWLGILSEKPSWVRQVVSDRIFLIGSRSDRAVVWRFRLRSREGLDSFESQLGRRIQDADDGGTSLPVVFQRNDQERYLWMHRNGRNLSLYFDDDRRIEPELAAESMEPPSFTSPGISTDAE